jgi:hypothetical protein
MLPESLFFEDSPKSRLTGTLRAAAAVSTSRNIWWFPRRPRTVENE